MTISGFENKDYRNGFDEGYQQGRADEIVKFILTLQEIYDYVWDRDIPSPTCPEYKEHHDDCIEIMAKIKDKIYQLKEQQA